MTYSFPMLRLFLCLVFLVHFSLCSIESKEVRKKILTQNASEECAQQYDRLDLLTLVKMLDASSKLLPSGVLAGNLNDLGQYDECLSIANETTKIYGKYCLATISLDELFNGTSASTLGMFEIKTLTDEVQEKLTNYSKIIGYVTGNVTKLAKKLKLGICIPDKCDNEYIQEKYQFVLDQSKCYTKFTNDAMDVKAGIALAIIYAFAFIAVASTIYEIVIEFHQIKAKHPILTAFSLYSNGKKLLRTSQSSDQLGCLNGLKTWSMVWVVLGHTYLNTVSSGTYDNVGYISTWLDDPINMFVLSATVSVDTFFTIGGLLTVYVFMRSPPMKMRESFKKIPFLYLHRYIRLTPPFAIMVLAYGTGLIKYLSDGPNWGAIDTSIKNCADNWWAALLYIQNYMPYKTLCVGQSWYLSADFQLFILTPFFLIPLKKWPKYVLSLLAVLSVIGMFFPFYIGYSTKTSGVGMGSSTDAFVNDYYWTTHTRYSPYLIGMIVGYYIYKIKSRGRPLTFSTGTLCLLWTLAVGTIFICIFDGYHLVQNGDNRFADGMYMGFNRSLWSSAISLLIFLCSTGNGGPINTFLSLPFFQVVAKLSYSIYLVHYIVIITIIFSSRTPIHMSNFTIMSQFFVHFILTFVISILFCLIFESPMITIERIIFPMSKHSNKPAQAINNKV